MIANNVIKALLRTDFPSFLLKVFQTLNPGTAYIHNWYIDLISEILKQVEKGEIKRLIINLPPRNLKSTIINVAWPAWLLAHNPAIRIISTSYSQSLSIKHSLDTRSIINSSWYQDLFPQVKIIKGQNQKYKFVTSKYGFRFASSVKGSLVGEGGDIIIVDDPHNPSHISSSLLRQNTIDWFEQELISRINDKKTGAIILIMQRLHNNDLSGYLLKKKNWKHLCLPAIATKKEVYSFGKQKVIRLKGDLLNPKREGKDEILNIKADIGSYAFASQYQQEPMQISGGMIKADWIKRFNLSDISINQDMIIYNSWDTAIKCGKNNDYSVCTTWLEKDNNYYLIDLLRLKLEYPELKKILKLQAQKYCSSAVLIEDKSSGQTLIQDIKKETSIPVIPIKVKQDKITRFATATVVIDCGRCYFPREASWLFDYEKELFSFPNSKNDDMVDSTSQFLNWVKNRNMLKPNIRNF